MADKNISQKPPLSEKGIVYIITEAFPPTSAGSSVLNKNLLSYFDPNSYVVYTHKISFKNQLDMVKDVRVRYIAKSFQHFSGKLHNLLLPFQFKYAFNKIKRDSKKEKPVAIIATYPSLDYIKLGLDIASSLKLPFFPYLHDTIAEALSNSVHAERATTVQAQIWKRSAHIFVMSDGMRDLYQKKYALKTEPVLHTYMEKIRNENELELKKYTSPRCFWGGEVYNINNVSLPRLTRALENLDPTIEIASPQKREVLNGLGITNKNLVISFYSDRSQYLKAIEHADILLLGLNWPEESTIHPEELGTIFPTKTPEYLSSGKLIIVHAPEQYFLTQFFKKHQCGIVLDKIDPSEVLNTLKQELNNPEKILSYRKNALNTAKLFNQTLVAENFKKSINNIIQQ